MPIRYRSWGPCKESGAGPGNDARRGDDCSPGELPLLGRDYLVDFVLFSRVRGVSGFGGPG